MTHSLQDGRGIAFSAFLAEGPWTECLWPDMDLIDETGCVCVVIEDQWSIVDPVEGLEVVVSVVEPVDAVLMIVDAAIHCRVACAAGGGGAELMELMPVTRRGSAGRRGDADAPKRSATSLKASPSQKSPCQPI
jgi:hypothetical protein